MFKIGWFSTGKEEASRGLLKTAWQAINKGKIPDVQIIYVFCNRELGENAESDKFLNLVKELGIPLVCLSSAKFLPALRKGSLHNWRGCYYGYVRDLLKDFNEDIRMLAGYMLILDAETCSQKPAINLHPALPGGLKGIWQDVTRQLIESRAKKSGVTIHSVIPELDAGPVITYCQYKIRKYDFDEIRRQGLKREFPLIVETLKLLAKGEIKINSIPPGGHDLTRLINKKIHRKNP